MTVLDAFRLDGRSPSSPAATAGWAAPSRRARRGRRARRHRRPRRRREQRGRRRADRRASVRARSTPTSATAVPCGAWLETSWPSWAGSTCWSTTPASASTGPALEVHRRGVARRSCDVNVDGVWNCCQVFGAQMIDARRRRRSSTSARSPAQIVNRPQWQPAYNASKAAVHQLTKSLAAEWAPHGVRVNALAPGYVKTEMAPVDDPQFRRHWIEDAPDAARTPRRRRSRPRWCTWPARHRRS